MAFTAITTQEEFDEAISARIKREQETQEKKYAEQLEEITEQNRKLKTELETSNGLLEELKKKSETYDSDIAERDAIIKSHETSALKSKIALELGIPYELAGRISGDNEESIRKDAEALSSLIDNQKPLQPLRSTEPEGDGKDLAYKELLTNLKGE